MTTYHSDNLKSLVYFGVDEEHFFYLNEFYIFLEKK